MLSIFVLFGLLVIFISLGYFFKRKWFYCVASFSFILLIVEVIVFGIFMVQIMKADCLHLIGNQKGLDWLMKLRLTYAVYFPQGRKYFVYQVDKRTGYSLGQDKSLGGYKINNQAFRADREYRLIPEDNILRLATFGDSFVFCDDEKNEDTWQYFLENMAGNLEVLNFGVSGYGLSQSYLRYLREGLQFHPDIVFFNYVLMGNRDEISPVEIFSASDLRMSHLYRVQFNVDDEGILTSKVLSPYDLFDKDFRRKYLYEPLGSKENPGVWSSPVFSKTNLGLMIKSRIFKKYFAKLSRKKFKTKNFLPENIKIIENLLKTVKAQNSHLLLFNCDYESLPEEIKEKIKEDQNVVTCVNGEGRLNETLRAKNINRSALLNSSNHFNAQGNKFYAEAVLQIFKEKSWRKEGMEFVFDEESQAFVRKLNEKKAN